MLTISLLSLITIGIGSIHPATATANVELFLGGYADWLTTNMIYLISTNFSDESSILFGKYLPECCMVVVLYIVWNI